MAAEWEVTGRLGELQLVWLRAHYTPAQLDAALAAVVEKGQRGYPLNAARWLQKRGGPPMPRPEQLEAADPQAKQRAAVAKKAALQRIRELGLLPEVAGDKKTRQRPDLGFWRGKAVRCGCSER